MRCKNAVAGFISNCVIFRQQLAYITQHKYISGESHYYWSKKYLLKVLVEPASTQGVKILRGKLEVISHH